MNYIISFPRSGNTFTRYIVEYISGMKSVDGIADETNQHISREQSPLINPHAETIITKRHDWNGVACDDSVLFVVRDYREVFIRNFASRTGISIESFRNAHQGNDGDYIGLLMGYEKHNGNKAIIRYEDLLECDSMTSVLETIGVLLDISEVNAEEFVSNYEYHAQRSLSFYPNSHSKGSGKKFHTEKIKDKSVMEEWKEYLMTSHPEIYSKYLAFYV